MTDNNNRSPLQVAVPVIIATIVLWLFQAGPFAPSDLPENDKPVRPYENSWYPLGAELTFTYSTKGIFRGETTETEQIFQRTILREAGPRKWQAVDSFKGKVVDNYFLEQTDKGIEITSTGLNKNSYLLLPSGFSPDAAWNISPTLRASADGVTEEIELSISINSKKQNLTVEALRVRYDRYYSKKVTVKPDWYFEGYVWFAKGYGIVKEDSTNVEIPQANGRIKFKETWEIKHLVEIKGQGF